MQNASDARDQIDARAAGAVHDFNNLLSVIMVCADEISALPGDGIHRERAAEIRSAAAHGAKLIKELLDDGATDPPALASDHTRSISAELESEEHDRGDVRIKRADGAAGAAIDPAATIEAILPMLERTLGNQARVRASSAEELPNALLSADALERILLNLAANSRTAFAEAQPSVSSVVIQSSLVAVRDGDPLLEAGWYVRIAFSDNGGGMDFDVAARALEPGFSTKREGGTGLGLSIVCQIVREAGGDVRLNTTPGVGTTITLYIPAQTAGDPQASDDTARQPDPARQL